MLSKMRRGSAVIDVVIAAAVVVFIILPVFSAVIEKFIILNKAQIIKDAVDMTNISVYNAINAHGLGKTAVNLDYTEAEDIFERLLAENMNLDENLSPKQDSLVEGKVELESLIFYPTGFPQVCPNGTTITRPAVHSLVLVPVKPSLYRQFVLNALGKDHVEMRVHVDSEIPINN